MKDRSTLTSRILMIQYLLEIVDKREQVEVLYTNFPKAFDKSDYSILMGKLRIFGFSLDAIILLYSYLIDRKLFVEYNGYSTRFSPSTTSIFAIYKLPLSNSFLQQTLLFK